MNISRLTLSCLVFAMVCIAYTAGLNAQPAPLDSAFKSLSCAPLVDAGEARVFRTERSVYVANLREGKVLQLFPSKPIPCTTQLDFNAKIFTKGIYGKSLSDSKKTNPFFVGSITETEVALESFYRTAREDSIISGTAWQILRDSEFAEPQSVNMIIDAISIINQGSAQKSDQNSQHTIQGTTQEPTEISPPKAVPGSSAAPVSANPNAPDNDSGPLTLPEPHYPETIIPEGATASTYPVPTGSEPRDTQSGIKEDFALKEPLVVAPPSPAPSLNLIESDQRTPKQFTELIIKRRNEFRSYWDNRLSIQLKKGDLVCTYRGNEFGILQNSDVENLTVLVLGHVFNAEHGFLFNNAAMDPNFEYEMVYLEGVKYGRNEISLCPFKL